MDTPPIRTLPGARFDCHSCGTCCRGFQIGPVPADTLEDLKARGASDLVPGLEGEPFYELRERRGEPEYFFRTVDGACVFLRDDNLCRIHGAWGADAKPWFCRAFPFALVAGPEGLRLAWRPDCAGRPNGATTPLGDYAEAVLADAEHYPFRAVLPDGIGLPGGAELPASLYPTVEARLLDAIERHEGPFEAVFPALGRVLAAVAQAVGAALPARQVGDPLALAEQVAAAAKLDDSTQAMRVPGPRVVPLDETASEFARQELANHVFSGAITCYGGLAAGLGAFLLAYLHVCGWVAARYEPPLTLAAFNRGWVEWHRATYWRDAHDDLAELYVELEQLFLAFAEAPA